MCERGNRNRGEWSVQTTDWREEVAHNWETQQKAVSIHCVSAGFPTRGPSAWKGECICFSWHGCLFILWPTAPPAQKDSPYRFDVYDTHTHILGGDRWKRKTLAHGETSVSCVNRHVHPQKWQCLWQYHGCLSGLSFWCEVSHHFVLEDFRILLEVNLHCCYNISFRVSFIGFGHLWNQYTLKSLSETLRNHFSFASVHYL